MDDGATRAGVRRARVERREVYAARRANVAAVVLALLLGGAVALTAPDNRERADAAAPASSAATADDGGSASGRASAPESAAVPTATPATRTSTPSPTPSAAICDDDDVRSALAGGTDDDVVTAVGGGEAFRAALTSGDSSCLTTSDAGRYWVIANKANPLDPLGFWPTPQAQPTDIRVTSGGGWLRADAAAALDDLALAIRDDGVGRLAVSSAFRPYSYQVDLYNGYVASNGREAADLRSARPGHSEHQTGLAVDVVACDSSCGTHDGLKGTPHAQWLVDNAWRYGFVIRYEDGYTDVTGYAWEPWHLRYIGVELATAYRDGGFHTLEDFFDLPAAPDYKE